MGIIETILFGLVFAGIAFIMSKAATEEQLDYKIRELRDRIFKKKKKEEKVEVWGDFYGMPTTLYSDTSLEDKYDDLRSNHYELLGRFNALLSHMKIEYVKRETVETNGSTHTKVEEIFRKVKKTKKKNQPEYDYDEY